MTKKTYKDKLLTLMVYAKRSAQIIDELTDSTETEYDRLTVDAQCSARGEMLESLIELLDGAHEACDNYNDALKEIGEVFA